MKSPQQRKAESSHRFPTINPVKEVYRALMLWGKQRWHVCTHFFFSFTPLNCGIVVVIVVVGGTVGIIIIIFCLMLCSIRSCSWAQFHFCPTLATASTTTTTITATATTVWIDCVRPFFGFFYHNILRWWRIWPCFKPCNLKRKHTKVTSVGTDWM